MTWARIDLVGGIDKLQPGRIDRAGALPCAPAKLS
jgi:hypothetical protein